MNTKTKLYQLKDYQIAALNLFANSNAKTAMHVNVKKQKKSKDQTKEQPC